MDVFESSWKERYFSTQPVWQTDDLEIYINPAPRYPDEFFLIIRPDGVHRVSMAGDWLTKWNLTSFSQLASAKQCLTMLNEKGLKLHSPDNVYYAKPSIKPWQHSNWICRALGKEDEVLFKTFCDKNSEQDLDDAYVELDHWAVYGLFDGDALVAVCSLYPWAETQLADLGVIVLPERRGQGLASELVKYASEQMESKGFVLQYRTQTDHIASNKVALSAGLVHYGTWQPLAEE